MANKLIDELIIKVKQQGAKPTETAVRKLGEALTEATEANESFNSELERTPKYLQRVEKTAMRTAKQLSKVKLNFSSAATEKSLGAIESSLETLVEETVDMNHEMTRMSSNLITLFENLANSLGGDLERIQDNLIDVQGEAGKTTASLNKLGNGGVKAARGLGGANRQGRNQARTFSDLAKRAGPLPLLYANIAANVFALSEAFRLLTEGEQLNRLEEVGTIIGGKIGTPVQLIAGRMQELTGYTLSYGDSLRQAAAAASYGFDSTQIEQLTMAARRASIALGVDMQDAMNRVIRGTSKLEIELLDELGITTKLTTAYENYAKALGVSADSLNSYQQRAALVNEINSQSVEKFGMLDAMLRDGAPWETFGSNVATSFQSAIKKISESTNFIAEFFNEIEQNNRRIQQPIETSTKLLDAFFQSNNRGGMVGLLMESSSEVEKLRRRLSELKEVNLSAFSIASSVKYKQEITNLQFAIKNIEGMINDNTLGIPSIEKANIAYKNLNSVIKGSKASYETTIASVKGSSAAYTKLYDDVEAMQQAYRALQRVDPGFKAKEALKALGFESEYALNSAVKLAEAYRDASVAQSIFAQTSAAASLSLQKRGADPEAIRLTILTEQLVLQNRLYDAQQKLGVLPAKLAKLDGQRLTTERQILNAKVAIVDKETQRANTEVSLQNYNENTTALMKAQLANEQTRLANLSRIEGSFSAQEASSNRIKQIQQQILETEQQQGMTIMNSALSNLATYGTGIDAMTSSLNNLALSFDTMGNSSMTATQMVGTGLQAFQGMLQYTSQMSIQTIDSQIAAEKKRDGKSKESVSKIAALEKKKIKEQQKAAKQQILISTAVAMMQAAANPWPMPAIPLMAAAALAGTLAYSQASSANSNMMAGAAGGSQTASLTVGERQNKVDVSQSASRGELAYMRNESGTGSMQSFTPRANGGIGTSGSSLIVGEHGPEVITPLEPIRAYSAEESKGMGSGGYTDNRQIIVNALDTQSIVDRADDIFDAWDSSASSKGMNSDRLF